jgi:hypothetical protein
MKPEIAELLAKYGTGLSCEKAHQFAQDLEAAISGAKRAYTGAPLQELIELHHAQQKYADKFPDRVRIVCAAQRTPSGVVVMGIRHFCPVMHINFALMGISGEEKINSESGFIDNYGRFLTRQEAFQIQHKTGHGDLYSEDLY